MSIKPINHYSLENSGTIYDEEATTALQLCAETAKKCNEVIGDQNALREETENHLNEQDNNITHIRDVVVPEDVSAEVQKQINNGTFDEQIDEHTAEITKELNETRATVTSEMNRIDLDLQQTENELNGRVNNLLANLNTGGDATSEIVDARDTFTTLGERLEKTFKQLPVGVSYEPDGQDLNTYLQAGTYVFNEESFTNGPENDNYSATYLFKPFTLKVETFGPLLDATGHAQYGKQTLVSFGSLPKTQCTRYFAYTNAGTKKFYEWHFEYMGISKDGCDINTVVQPGTYMITTTKPLNTPLAGGGHFLKVENYSSEWLVQTVYDRGSRSMWFRTGRNQSGKYVNFDESITPTWGEWKKIVTQDDLQTAIESIESSFSNKGYVITNMGDSITGNTQDDTSISGQLANATGATTHNFGFGGCRMSHHTGDWDAFSMCNIADAIASGDFSTQETAAGKGTVSSYFANTVAKMKNLDFSTVDIMTIGYGTNDWSSGCALDNANNPYDTNSFAGALRYSIETLLTAHPNMRIVLVGPCWRFKNDDSGNFLYGSDEWENKQGVKIIEFVNKTLEIANDYHLPVVDPYNKMGINKFNYSQWFEDATHPNAEGRKQLAKLIGNTIRGM